MAKKVRIGIGLAIVLFGVVQIVPVYRPSNPPVVAEPVWDSSRTRELAKRACFDCHSNETVWPWYGHVAPVSWLVVGDVKEARGAFNLSDWHSGDTTGEMAARHIANGEMPLPRYVWLHREARLTAQEKEELIAGLKASLR